jgi:glycosyltransferase involved in cell wall biosynthesis
MIELSIVMPCLNEAETLGACIGKAQKFISDYRISGEVVIGDNGSTDGSQEIARRLGARVIDIPVKGYGSALIGAINASKGKYVIMGDSDDSYDFSNLGPFVEKLREGYDLVMGNRFTGGISKGAMPFLHKYLGNPVLSFLGKLFFKSNINDFHCGLRGFRQDIVNHLNLQTTGMEFASEMVVKSTINKLKIAEVPTTLSPDGRTRPPHLRTWRDGWRHLRFLLIYSPRWLFMYPGFLMILAGVIGSCLILIGKSTVGEINFSNNSLLYCAAAVIIGFQSVIFAVFTRIYGTEQGFLPLNPGYQKIFRYFKLELGLVISSLLVLAGLLTGIYSLAFWKRNELGNLDLSVNLKLVIPSVTFLITGFQLFFASFFLSILGIQRKKNAA